MNESGTPPHLGIAPTTPNACDAMSFNLFDRTPHAWTKVVEWSSKEQRVREAHGVPPTRGNFTG